MTDDRLSLVMPTDYDFVVLGDQRLGESKIYRSVELSSREVAAVLRRLADAYDPGSS